MAYWPYEISAVFLGLRYKSTAILISRPLILVAKPSTFQNFDMLEAFEIEY